MWIDKIWLKESFFASTHTSGKSEFGSVGSLNGGGNLVKKTVYGHTSIWLLNRSSMKTSCGSRKLLRTSVSLVSRMMENPNCISANNDCMTDFMMRSDCMRIWFGHVAKTPACSFPTQEGSKIIPCSCIPKAFIKFVYIRGWEVSVIYWNDEYFVWCVKSFLKPMLEAHVG